ncbi:MAG: Rpn family recombination-promoting nuclease/putative transposase [Treponema sp.]|jgi:predicted transposase/invertase (TIGR01784 family)|nr:Rpn family recombination-promoting nuclease/putative transposase [Treponema sp.]
MEVIRTKQGIEILLPKIDFIFKTIFGDEHNRPLLKSFLQAVLYLAEDEFEIELVNPYLQPVEKDGKLCILDVKIRTKTGKLIDIEMQIIHTANIFERICFYKAKMLVEQVGAGESYDRIKKVINIVITDFSFIESGNKGKKGMVSPYHHCFRLYDPQDAACFGDVEEIHTLELPKLPRESDNTAIWDWVKYIGVRTEEDLTMLAEKSEVLRHAVSELYRVSVNEEIRYAYEVREKAWRDEKDRMDSALNRGRAEARAESKALIEQFKSKNEQLESKNEQLESEIERLRRELAQLQQNHA